METQTKSLYSLLWSTFHLHLLWFFHTKWTRKFTSLLVRKVMIPSSNGGLVVSVENNLQSMKVIKNFMKRWVLCLDEKNILFHFQLCVLRKELGEGWLGKMTTTILGETVISLESRLRVFSILQLSDLFIK